MNTLSSALHQLVRVMDDSRPLFFFKRLAVLSVKL